MIVIRTMVVVVTMVLVLLVERLIVGPEQIEHIMGLRQIKQIVEQLLMPPMVVEHISIRLVVRHIELIVK